MWAALTLACDTGQAFEIVKAENPVWPAEGDFLCVVICLYKFTPQLVIQGFVNHVCSS